MVKPNTTALNEGSSQWLWVTARLIHSSVPCLVIVREVSFCSRWEPVDVVPRTGDLGMLSCKQDVSIKSIPSGFREPCRRGGRKNLRRKNQSGRRTPKKRRLEGPLSNTIKTCMNSQRLRQHAQVLPGSASGPILASSLMFLWDSKMGEWTGSCFLYLHFGLFSFCLCC